PGGNGGAVLRHRGDRHQSQRLGGAGPKADRRRLPGGRRRGQVPETDPGALRAAGAMEPGTGDPVGADDLHRLPAEDGIRRARIRVHRPPLPRARHPLVRLLLGRRSGRVHGALRSSVLQGGLGVAHRSRPAARHAGHRPAADPVDRHVHPGGDRRSGRRRRPRGSAAGSLDVELSVPAGRSQPAHAGHPGAAVPGVPGRVFGARDRSRAHLGGGGAGRLSRRAAHHPRPRPVGERPGGLGRDRRLPAPGAEHPRRREVARRRRQEGLRRRVGADRQAAAGEDAAARRRGVLTDGLAMVWKIGAPVVTVLAAVLLVLLERRFPYDRGQKLFREGFWTDLLLYALLQSYVLALVIGGALLWLDGQTGWSRLGILSRWPVAAQVLFFVVTHDLYIYWFHRWQHSSPRLWRLHEAHHSARSIDWLAGARSHAFEILINQTIEFAPMLLLGAAPEVPLIKGMI